MSIESANQIINEQDLTIEDLRHKVLDMTDERDLAICKALKLIEALSRIRTESSEVWISVVCRNAIAEYHSK